MASIDFKQLDNINKNCINWSNKSILDQCKITPIDDNETIENLQTLACKNSLQRKIAADQHKKIMDIYSARSKPLEKKYEIDKIFSNEDLHNRHLVIYSNTYFDKYYDLDSLLVLQKYQDGKHIVTINARLAELDFIKHLAMVIKIQRIMIDKQLLKIVSLYKRRMYTQLSTQYLIDIDNSNLDFIEDKRLSSHLKLLHELWTQKEAAIYKIISSDQYSMPAENIKIYKLIKKMSAPKAILFNCCVCFENIKTKIGLVPCGHTAICTLCASNINKCPICTTPFTQFIKIFDN